MAGELGFEPRLIGFRVRGLRPLNDSPLYYVLSKNNTTYSVQNIYSCTICCVKNANKILVLWRIIKFYWSHYGNS